MSMQSTWIISATWTRSPPNSGQFTDQTKGHVVFCADDPRLAEMLARNPRAISYGRHPLGNLPGGTGPGSGRHSAGIRARF